MAPTDSYSVYKKKMIVVLVTFLVYILYPIILQFYLLILIYRQLVCVIVKRDEVKKMMSGFDTMLTYPSPYKDPRSVLLTMFPLKSPVDINNVKRNLESGLLNAKFSDGSLKFPELKQRIVSKWGYSFWRQVDSFSLDNHVKYLCPENPFRTVQRSEFGQLLKCVGNNFDHDCSPWELLVVPKFVDPEDTSVKGLILVRIHHSMCDGFAMVNFTHHMSIHPEAPSTNPNCLPMSWNPFKWIVLIRNLLSVLVKAPYVLTRKMVYQPEFNPMLEAARNLQRTQRDRQLTYIESKPMAMAELKPIQNYCNIRSASVIIGIYVEVILEAMRLKKVPLPHELNVIIPFPAPSHSGTLTNCFVADQMVVKICPDDPLQTLKNVETSYSQFQNSDVSYLITYFVDHFLKFPSVFRSLQEDKPDCTSLLTNFRYGLKQFDMFGSDVVEANCYGVAPANPPFVFSCLGYNGKIRFCGGVDTALFDELDAKEIQKKFDTQLRTYLDLVSTASNRS